MKNSYTHDYLSNACLYLASRDSANHDLAHADTCKRPHLQVRRPRRPHHVHTHAFGKVVNSPQTRECTWRPTMQLSATQTRPVRKNSQSLRMFMRLLCCGSAIWLSNKSVCRLWQDSHPGFATLSCCCWRSCIPDCRPLLDVEAAEWADPSYAPACV